MNNVDGKPVVIKGVLLRLLLAKVDLLRAVKAVGGPLPLVLFRRVAFIDVVQTNITDGGRLPLLHWNGARQLAFTAGHHFLAILLLILVRAKHLLHFPFICHASGEMTDTGNRKSFCYVTTWSLLSSSS